jgi:hypothetical protein
MLVKEQTEAPELDAKLPEHKPGKKPDFLDQAKSALEQKSAGVLGRFVSPKEAIGLQHPTAQSARVASALHAQQTEGNYYVRRAVEQYRKSHPAAQDKPAVEKGKPSAPAAKPGAVATHPGAAPVHGDYVQQVIADYNKAHLVTPSGQKKTASAVQSAAGMKVPAPGAKPGGAAGSGPPSLAATQAQKVPPLAQKPAASAAGKTPAPAQDDDKTKAVSIDKQAGKVQIVDVTKPKKAAGGADAGGAPGDDVQHWTNKVKGAAEKQLTPPDLANSKQAPDKIKNEGDSLVQQQQHNKPDYLGDGSKSLPPAPKVDNPPEAQSDELEKSSRDLIAAVADKRLADQSLPELNKSPGYPQGSAEQKVQPRIPSLTTPPTPTPEAIPRAAPPADASGAGQVKTDTSKIEDAQKKIDQPATPGQSASPQQLTLKDAGGVPKPPVPEKMKSDIAGALAVVLSKADDAAKEVTGGAELSAFPRGALKKSAPEIAQKHVEPEKQDISKELHQISDAAGLAQGVIDERSQKLKEDAKKESEENSAELDKATADVKTKNEGEGQSQRIAIKTAGASLKDSIEKKKEAANVPLDNKAVEEKEKRLMTQVTKDAALAQAQYDKALEKRRTDLDKAGATYDAAYRRTAREEAADVKGLYQDNDEKARVESRPSLDWGENQAKAIDELLPFLKSAASKQVETLKSAVTDQKTAALTMVQTWANHNTSTVLSLWRRFLQLFTAWADDAKIKAEAWEEVRDQETTNQMVADFQTIANLKDLAAKGNIQELQAAIAGLSEEQQALFMLFFRTGADSVMTVATAMLGRMEARRTPKLAEQLRTEVFDLEWEKLDDLGYAQDQNFSANALAWQVHSAIAGLGTNEEKLFAAIGRRTPVQIAAMKKRYQNLFGSDMQEDIDDDLSGDEAKRATAALAGDKTGEDVAALHDAIDSIITDKAAIMQLLRNKTPEERQQLFDKYKQEYGIDLKDHLHQELEGDDKDRADALLAGDMNKADAIGLQQSMHYHWHGGAEIKELDSVYAQIQREVEEQAESRNLTTAEVEAEIKKRSQAVQREWEAKYGGGKPGSMEDAFKDRFDDAEKDLALARTASDRTAQDSARIGMESQSARTNDEKVLRILSSQRERAATEIRRDMLVHLKERSAKEKWSPEEAKKKLDEMSTQAESDIDTRAEKYLGDLEKVYDKNYSKGWGPGALTAVVEMEMDGNEQAMARAIRNKGSGGKLKPEDEVFWSVDGPGTNDDHLKHALMDANGRPRWSKQELKHMADAYKTSHPGRDFYDDVRGDVSGRFGFDINQALEGKPERPEEYRKQMQAKTMYELGGSGGIGFLFAQDESIALLKTSMQAEEVYKQYQAAAKDNKDSPEAKALFERYKRWSSYTDNAVEGTRESVDAITDHAAMAAALAVGLVVAVATAGTATPGVVAGLSALAATATSISVKAAMKGNAYGLEDLGTDAVIGAIDIAAAALTAGVGSALLRTNILAKLSEEQLLTRLAKHGIAHGVGGMVAGLPAGLAAQLMNDQIWKNDEALKTILLGMTQTMGTGLAMGSVISMGFAVKASPEAHVSGKSSPKADVHDVPPGKPKPDFTAEAKAAADASPATKIDTQLKPIVNADEHAQTPGSSEAKVARNVAKVKAILDPTASESKMAGTGKGTGDVPPAGKTVKDPSKGTTYVEPGTREHHAMLKEGWTAEMLAKGLGPFDVPAAPKGPPLEAGTYKGGIKTPNEAYVAYNEAMARAPGREVGIFRNLDTGEYFVQVGSADSVGRPAAMVDSAFEAVLHYHPNEANVLTYRMPSVTDVSHILLDSVRLNGRPVTQFIEYPVPEGGRGRTAFQVEIPEAEAGAQRKPIITLEYIDENGVRQKKAFSSLDDFHKEWTSRTRFTDPGSPEYKEFLADAERARLRSIWEKTGTSPPEELPMENRMAGGSRVSWEDFQNELLQALKEGRDPTDIADRTFGPKADPKAGTPSSTTTEEAPRAGAKRAPKQSARVLDPQAQIDAARAKQAAETRLTAESKAIRGTQEEVRELEARLKELDNRPPRPPELDNAVRRLPPPEDTEARLEAVKELRQKPGLSDAATEYLKWLQERTEIQHKLQDIHEGNIQASRNVVEPLQTITVPEAVAEARAANRTVKDLLRIEGPNYEARSNVTYDQILGEKRWAEIPSDQRVGLQTDHLVPLDRVANLPELAEFLEAYQKAPASVKNRMMADLIALGDRPENLVRINEKANNFKSNKSWHDITYDEARKFFYEPADVDRMRAAETKELEKILADIAQLTKDYQTGVPK